MNQIELLAPAGSMEAAVAAVQSGADAIYLGFGDFNARRNAKNFSAAEMADVISFCRARGVKTHVTLNTLLNDREFSSLEETVRILNDAAPDAVIVADLGVARAISSLAPELCLHASTQLTVHSADGARAAKQLGFSRVVLSRELSFDAISKITREVDIETEVFVHGALCMCYSGQCYMSGFIGKRSGNRGLCAQPCRLPYRVNDARRESYPLSLRDLCLAHELPRLREAGVSSLKIEGRMKRPEYVAVVCSIYSRLLRENRAPNEDELLALHKIFSRDGFTDGYFNNKHGASMFGVRSDDVDPAIYKDAQRLYAQEMPRIPVHFSCDIHEGAPLTLTAVDDRLNTHTATGIPVEVARTRSLDETTVRDKLSKTGGTPFFVDKIDISLGENCSVPVSALNSLRRECLDKLLELRASAPKLKFGKLAPLCEKTNDVTAPKITLCVRDASQIPKELSSLPIERVYIPLDAIDNVKTTLPLGIILPQIIWDNEWDDVLKKLSAAKKSGITHALISNVGQIAPLVRLGFTVEGDIGLNIFNSRTLEEYKKLGLSCATLSPELMLAQVRDINKCMPTELVVYGHLPLMTTENCAIASGGKCPGHGTHTLTDRRGARFLTFCLPRHRNLICNADVMYLADKLSDIKNTGVSRMRLYFTVERAREVLNITREYLSGTGEPPSNFTRGLYFRGVE